MIRRATAADAAAVSRIHTAARGTWAFPARSVPTDEATWRERISGEAADTFVFERGGGVCGFLAVGDVDDDDLAGQPVGEVLALYVDPGLQGGGVGSALLGEATARRRAQGDEAIVLWTNEGNAQARGFYERRGFALDLVDDDEWRYRREL